MGKGVKVADSDKRFKEGQQIKRLMIGDAVFAIGEYSTMSQTLVEDIVVIMENGQMAGVPWALVTYGDGSQNKINLALTTIVHV